MQALRIFRIKKEERALIGILLLVFIAFNALLIAGHWDVYTMGAKGGFWSIFTKNFRMSGYDNWSWITVSGMRIHFETIRHPLFLTFLYPLYWLNHWLIGAVGVNFAVFFMAAIIVFSATYAAVFSYRIFREVMELGRPDATLLTLLLFSFAHVLVPTMVPDHFAVSLMLLCLTLYITGMKLKKNLPLKAWQSFLLMFFTAGMTTSNGAKVALAGLFANGKRFFSWRYILVGVLLPVALLAGIRQSQYYLLEVPQQAVIHNIEQTNKKKNAQKVEKHTAERNKWLKEHQGKAAGDGFIGKLMDVSTPRGRTLVENFFGESLQLHTKFLLKDVSWDRPIFVSYSYIGNYIVEALLCLLLLAGALCGIKQRFMQMLLAWFACDVTLHLVLGFAINEVYIMTAGWAFIIPIAGGYLLLGLRKPWQQYLRVLLGLLTAYLWIYNGGLTASYLLNILR